MKFVTASANRELDELLDLITVNVQLTKTQHDQAKSGYEAVGEWLRAEESPVRLFSPLIFPQGSLALQTTVKPLTHTEFDLDLVCLLSIPDSILPSVVYELLLQRMKAHGTYAGMIVEMPRCIRLDYAGDFHLDIVPAVPDSANPPGGTFIKIPDREKHAWRDSNPKGFAKWFADATDRRPLQEKLARFSAKGHIEPLADPTPAYSKRPLPLAVQLLKRWRDVAFKGREKLAPSSIVLTTLAGLLYQGEDHPTDALVTILNGVHEWASREPIRLRNPSNPKEWITDRWDDDPEMYDAFVAEIFDFRVRWEKLVKGGIYPDFVSELKALFDEGPVGRAVATFAEARRAARASGNLYLEKPTGVLLPAASPVAVKVKDHTFHGA